jgi:hypothetical protein
MNLKTAKAYAAWKAIYLEACKHDKIDFSAPLSVFSVDNPHLEALHAAGLAYFATRTPKKETA